MRVLIGHGEALDRYSFAAHRLDERLQIRRRGDYMELVLRRGSPGRQERRRQGENERDAHYFLAKIDFGIMQWTPLRTSTT